MIFIVASFDLVEGGGHVSVRSSLTPLAAAKSHLWKYHSYYMHGGEFRNLHMALTHAPQ